MPEQPAPSLKMMSRSWHKKCHICHNSSPQFMRGDSIGTVMATKKWIGCSQEAAALHIFFPLRLAA
jgi:hypothetical protein